MAKTPDELGYRLPAEWEEHEATWLCWPHNGSDWPGKLTAVRWTYVEIIRNLVENEDVHLITQTGNHSRQAQSMLARVGVDSAKIHFHTIPANRGWIRDFGPLFITRARPRPSLAVAHFGFNGWARYKNWQKDNRVTPRLIRSFGYRSFTAKRGNKSIILEGGSLDVDGRGTCLATEECLLDQEHQVRNPGCDRQEMESIFRQYLGIRRVIWLGRGIEGDDTHGHIDDCCRWVANHTVVACRESLKRDPNHAVLEENRERLASVRTASGSKLDVVDLPMSKPLFMDGERLPASYANFYITNGKVLVPTFNDPNDRIALGILAELFRGRKVIGIHAVDLVLGLGTLHCLTMQQPKI